MGSGHFLVAAVDRIEKSMANYLDKRPLTGVQNIIDEIKNTAKENLKDILGGEYFPIENRKILARQIARHCIYGVDNNDLAVQLSKLSLWTHTFIPGLPLSYFNHNLICGDALIGIGTIQEFQEEFNDIDPSGKLINTEKLIGQAKKPLRNIKNFSDLDLDDVQKGHENQRKIESSLKDTKALFDVVIFNRIKIKSMIVKSKNGYIKRKIFITPKS